MLQVVIDTNLFFAGLRSPRGASYQILRLLDKGHFGTNLSVPLVLEYESIAKRHVAELPIDERDIDDFIDYICLIANRHEIYYLWRPTLRDPADEMVLEVAIVSNSDAIVTFNKKDFRGFEQFGLRLLTPAELLLEIGVLK